MPPGTGPRRGRMKDSMKVVSKAVTKILCSLKDGILRETLSRNAKHF